uniref:Reverse transcriptase Ty1/copia-type domain-containing protein n=1 Tax=Chenopodium quinoa TaxID=63459 RepID=A0A803KWT5_CHEQI
MKGHTIDGCFKIYGYPDWFKNKPKGKTGVKYAANVSGTGQCIEDDPLESSEQGQLSNSEKPDSEMMNAVVQQDPSSREVVGYGEKSGGLYKLKLDKSAVLKWEIPFERLMKRKARYEHLKVIGCLCYASNMHRKGDKFVAKATRCVLIGYPSDQKGYKVFDLESKQIFVSRDMSTDNILQEIPLREEEEQAEVVPEVQHEVLEQGIQILEKDINEEMGDQEQDDHRDHEQNMEQEALRRSVRDRRAPSKFKGFECDKRLQQFNYINQEAEPRNVNLVHITLDNKEYYTPNYIVSLNNVMKIDQPNTYREASKDPRWVKAMQEELQAIENNGTWEIVDLPKGKKAIDSKRVYVVKLDPNGKIVRLKARLVSRGDRQVAGKDYKATFSPVANFASV